MEMNIKVNEGDIIKYEIVYIDNWLQLVSVFSFFWISTE